MEFPGLLSHVAQTISLKLLITRIPTLKFTERNTISAVTRIATTYEWSSLSVGQAWGQTMTHCRLFATGQRSGRRRRRDGCGHRLAITTFAIETISAAAYVGRLAIVETTFGIWRTRSAGYSWIALIWNERVNEFRVYGKLKCCLSTKNPVKYTDKSWIIWDTEIGKIRATTI